MSSSSTTTVSSVQNNTLQLISDESISSIPSSSSSSSSTNWSQASSSSASSDNINNNNVGSSMSSQQSSSSGSMDLSGLMQPSANVTALSQYNDVVVNVSTPNTATLLPNLNSYIFPSFQQQYVPSAANTNTNDQLGASTSGSLNSTSGTSTLIANSSTTSNDEPELKKVKLSAHYQYLQSIEHLKQANMLYPSSFMQPLGHPSTSQSSNNMYIVHKKLEERIGGILCCTVCLDLPQTAIYQCSNGHLMCAGCFSHLLADARLKDEQATCPNCRCEISKTSCCRNLAVEKTLSELPASCSYCGEMYPRNLLDIHQRNECTERPTKCAYKRIGCTWEGPFHEFESHSDHCNHQNKSAKDIMNFLKEKDAEVQEEQQSLLQLANVLSFEKVCFNDLQFKQYKTDEITPKLYFETNRFSAYFHQWVLKARVNDNQKNPNLSLNRFISYQLILKSKLTSTQSALDVKFCLLKGPFGEVPINACVQSFEFTANKCETDYMKLNIKSSDCNKLLASKIINFRFFMFQP